MRGSTLSYLSWGALLLALAACALAGFVALDLSGELTAREQSESSANSAAVQQANAVEISSLAQETALQRGELDTLVQTDVVGIANSIEAAGKSAGVATSIAAASSGTPPLHAPSNLNALEFVVESTGSFAQVFRAAQLFETLPLPSSVEELDFEHVPSSGSGAGNASWQLTAHILVFTTAQVSS